MANSYGGWTGKILRVDLSTGKISSEDSMKYKDFLGGTGLGYKVLWDEVKPGTKAWDPENRLIFGIGPLSGTGAPLSGRVSITALSPRNRQSLPESGHMGGHWGAELKFAGWDSIIVQGKADKPVWIYIKDDQVEIRDASRLWGNGIFRTTAEICAETGPETRVAAIGQAGENLVRLSCIMCDRSHSAGGLGSVMGAKNLKAIAVRGTGSLKIAAGSEDWKEAVHEQLKLLGANSGGVVPRTPQPWAEYYGGTRWTARKGLFWGAASPPLETGECTADDLNRMALRTHKGVLDHGDGPGERHTVRMAGCHACPIRCHVATDVAELEQYGVSRYQINTCSGNSTSKAYYTSLPGRSEIAILISQLGTAIADDYGVWNDYGQSGRDFNYAYENGIIEKYLDEKEYASIPWDKMEANDPDFAIDILRRIAYKEGELGQALADGSDYLEERWPEMAEAHNKEHDVLCWKMGHAKHHATESGGQIGGLINLIYNRDPMCHTHTNFMGCGLPNELQKEILAEICGAPDAIPGPDAYEPMTEAKAKFVALSLIYMELENSLTLCNYTLPTWASPRKELNYRGDVNMDATIYSAVTGDEVDQEAFEKIGLRILTMFRALTARQMNEADQRNKHDTVPDWVYEYPEDEEPFTPGCQKMDRDDMELGKEMLYAHLGWDKATGMPTRATLEDLGLEDVADELESLKLLPA